MTTKWYALCIYCAKLLGSYLLADFIKQYIDKEMLWLKWSIYHYDMHPIVLLHKIGWKAKHYGKLAGDITHELSQTIIDI